MLRPLRRLAAAFAVVGLLMTPAGSATASSYGSKQLLESETAPPMFDVLVLRPLGFAGLVASAGLWVPAQVITMIVRPTEWRTPIEHMLVKPYRYVFVDPLGSH